MTQEAKNPRETNHDLTDRTSASREQPEQRPRRLRRSRALAGAATARIAFIGLLLALSAVGPVQATRPKDRLDIGDERDVFFVRNLAVSPDGKYLAIYSDCRLDRAVTLWDIAARKQVATPYGNDIVGDFAFSPDGKYLIICVCRPAGKNKYPGTAIFWDLATHKESRRVELEQGPVWPTIITPDGKSLIVGTADRGVLVVSLESGKQTKALTCDNPRKDAITALAVSPDGKTLAAGRRDVLLLFDLEKGELSRRIEAPKEVVDNANPAKLGGVPLPLALQMLYDWPGETDMLAFSPDGKRLVSACRMATRVLVWDPATGKNMDVLRFDSRVRSTQVLALAFSPDGATLALGRPAARSTYGTSPSSATAATSRACPARNMASSIWYSPPTVKR